MKQLMKLRLAYLLIGGSALSLYTASGLLGWELSSGSKAVIPASARSHRGGIIAAPFWYSGFRGGK